MQPTLRRLKAQATRLYERSKLERWELAAQLRRAEMRCEAGERQLARAKQMIETLSAVSSVTGLPNERAVGQHLAQEVRRVARSGEGLCILRIEVDGIDAPEPFSPHELEQVIGIALGRTTRRTDVLGHPDTGVFEVVLPDTSVDGALIAARRMLTSVTKALPAPDDGQSAKWSICIGVAGLAGKPSTKFTADDLVSGIRERAHDNIVETRQRGQAFMRLDTEIVAWPSAEQLSAQAA